MSDIHGLKGLNKLSPSFNQIIVAYGNGFVNLGNAAGFGIPINITNDVSFEVFGDNLFFQNYIDRPLSFDGSRWVNTLTPRTMLAKYQKAYNSRLFLGNCSFATPQPPLDLDSNTISFPSRVFYSDFKQGNTLTWSIEWGRNGSTFANTRIFQLTTTGGTLVQDFKATNIKVGDPLFITSGNAQLVSEKPYLVSEIDSAYRLIVDREFPVTANSLHFWVGSNWFDIETAENDEISGFGENAGRLMIFKTLSVFLASSSNASAISQLIQLKGAKGASSSRSIINDYLGNTYWFHGSISQISGIYKFDRVNVAKISRKIDPWIAGMTVTNYSTVVAWQDANELRWYLGDLDNSNFDIDMDRAVASLNLDVQGWTVDPIADPVTDSTTFRIGNEQRNFIADNANEVMRMGIGNNFNGSNIASTLETKVYYPKGSEVINTFESIQVIGRQTRGVRVKYKLWDNPTEVDQRWFDLGECSGDKTELIVPHSHNQASGIQFKFDEVGTFENDFYIEKISGFYKVSRSRLLT